MNRRLLALYPLPWRERYGDELAELSDDLIAAGETTPLRASLDVIAEAARERGRAAVRSGAWPATSASVCLIAGTLLALNRRGGAMLPYFDRHAIGNLLLIVIVCWFFLEFVLFMRVQERRDHSDGVVRTGRAGWWLLAGVCVIVTTVWMYLAPTLVPEATICRGAIAFTVGMVILVAGIGLRLWSVLALDRLFSATIRVRPDQAVVTAGPYRLVRHPCYAGSLLAQPASA